MFIPYSGAKLEFFEGKCTFWGKNFSLCLGLALYHPTFALAKSKTTAPRPSRNYTARADKPLFASSEKALANKQNHIMLVLINLLALGLMAATIAIPATIIFNIYRATHEDHFC